MGVRRVGRELALQTLYMNDISALGPEKSRIGILRGEDLDGKAKEFAGKLVEGTFANIEAIDAVIVKYAANWELNRMAALDRNILRLGAYELMHEIDTPISVIIDEAVEIAKTYSTPDSGKFVNGILDKIKSERPNGASSHGQNKDN